MGELLRSNKSQIWERCGRLVRDAVGYMAGGNKPKACKASEVLRLVVVVVLLQAGVLYAVHAGVQRVRFQRGGADVGWLDVRSLMS
jgi:hypothetical protein